MSPITLALIFKYALLVISTFTHCQMEVQVDLKQTEGFQERNLAVLKILTCLILTFYFENYIPFNKTT